MTNVVKKSDTEQDSSAWKEERVVPSDIERRLQTFRELVGHATDHLTGNTSSEDDDIDDCEVDSDRNFMNFFSSSEVHGGEDIAGEDIQMDTAGRWGMRFTKESRESQLIEDKPKKIVEITSITDVRNWGIER